MADSAAPVSAPAAPTGGSIALSPAAVGGRRHHMRKVSAKTIKRTLKKLGMKPKGRVVLKGGEMDAMAPAAAPEPEAPSAGRRHRRGGKTKRSASRRHRKASIFGL